MVNIIYDANFLTLPDFPTSSSQLLWLKCGSCTEAAGRLLGSCSSSVGAESIVVKKQHSGARLPGFVLFSSETLHELLHFSLPEFPHLKKGDTIIVSETFNLAPQIFRPSPLWISAITSVTICVTSNLLHVGAS